MRCERVLALARLRAPRAALASPFARNAVALYGVQIVGFVFPLITAPYLARVLRPDGWGRVAFAQSFGLYLALSIEYGFGLSATRDVARNRDALAARADLFGAVVGAKAVLALIAVTVAGMVTRWIPVLRVEPLLLWSAVFWAVAQGFHPLWYYQGREDVRPVLALDVTANAAAIAAVFVLCREPADAWKVLALQGCAATFVVIGGYSLAARELPLRWPTWAAIRGRLATGAGLFAYRAAMGLYTVGNALLLGTVALPATVGYFAAAEKIVKSLFLVSIYPLHQALYPRISRIAHADPADAARLVRRVIPVFGGLGTIGGVVVFFAAPFLVRVLFGAGYSPAIRPLEILALLLPILSLSTAIVMHLMLPAALDRVLLVITVAAAALNVALAVVLARPYGEVGMAVSVVTVEAVVLAAVCIVARKLA